MDVYRLTQITLDKIYHKQLGKPKDHPAHNKFIKFRNLYSSPKRQHKRNYYFDIFQQLSNDIRKQWQIIRKIISKENDKSSLFDRFRHDSDIITNPKTIANLFCDYFSSVGQQFASKIPIRNTTFNTYLSKNKKSTKTIYLAPTDPDEIFKILTTMKAKKSTGHDNISTHFLKNNKHALCIPISIL